MSAYDLAMVVLGALFFGVAWWQMPRLWRGEGADSILSTGKLFLFGPAGRKGIRRGVPLALAGGTLVYVPVAVSTLTGLDPPQTADVLLVIVLLGVGVMALTIPVYFFNRPKIVVPPLYRDEPGAIVEWWHARKPRRKHHGGGERGSKGPHTNREPSQGEGKAS